MSGDYQHAYTVLKTYSQFFHQNQNCSCNICSPSKVEIISAQNKQTINQKTEKIDFKRVSYLCDGSCAKYFLAFSYDIGCSPSIKSDKSMSKVGPRLLSSDPYDTWLIQNIRGYYNWKWFHKSINDSEDRWPLPTKEYLGTVQATHTIRIIEGQNNIFIRRKNI